MQPLIKGDVSTRDDVERRTESGEVLSALRRFARSRPEIERCELCGSPLSGEHPHLLDRKSRRVTCACDGCAILFCGQEGAQFLRVPRRTLKLEGFRFSDIEWEAMMLPINLAFFLRKPNGEAAVLYPSPAGVMESLIGLPSWKEMFGDHLVLSAVEPEVEALLVNRIGAQAAYFIVPIDTCYRLVGLIRTKWRGLSGGPEVWKAIGEFFATLERQPTSVIEAAHA
jgi:hypothetical protein